MFSVWEVVGSSPPRVPVRLCLDMVFPLWEEPVASDSFFRRTGCFWKPQGLSGLQDQISWDQILQVASRSQKPLDFWHNGWLFFPLTQQGSSLPPSYLFAVSHVWCLAQAMVWIRLETSSCKTESTFLLLHLPLKSEKRLRRISFWCFLKFPKCVPRHSHLKKFFWKKRFVKEFLDQLVTEVWLGMVANAFDPSTQDEGESLSLRPVWCT